MKTTYALYSHTQDDASVLFVSEDKERLAEKLREMAKEHATMISGYDDDTYDQFWKESVETATDFWSDEDDEYPLWYEISLVPVI